MVFFEALKRSGASICTSDLCCCQFAKDLQHETPGFLLCARCGCVVRQENQVGPPGSTTPDSYRHRFIVLKYILKTARLLSWTHSTQPLPALSCESRGLGFGGFWQLPVYCLMVFGCFALAKIGVGLISFKDCSEDAALLDKVRACRCAHGGLILWQVWLLGRAVHTLNNIVSSLRFTPIAHMHTFDAQRCSIRRNILR